MTKKTSKARTEAFFKALSETGNQTISAERACVSRSWAGLQARADPAFKARMQACIAAAHARLCGAEGMDPARILGPEWACMGGDALVIRRAKSGLMQVMRPPEYQFTPAHEARFLGHLEETANARMAHDAIGMTSKAVYEHRKRWPEFDRRWKAALERGRLRLDARLIHSASNGPDAPGGGLGFDLGFDLDRLIPPMTVEQAMHQLHRHKYVMKGIGKRPRWPSRTVDVDALKVEILRKMAILERAERLGIADISP